MVTVQGDAVRGLTRENFEVKFKSQAARILKVEPMNRGFRVAVVLDTSGSMQGERIQASVYHALGGFLQTVPGDTQTAFIAFSDRVNTSLPFGTPPEEIVRSIKGTFAERKKNLGRTALIDAIGYASKLFDKPRIGDAIVVFTDGGDNRSKLTVQKLKREFSPNSIRIFAEVFGAGSRSSVEEVLGPYRMSELVDETGGIMYGVLDDMDPPHSPPGTGAQIMGVALARDMMATYLLRFEPPSPIPFEKLRIEAGNDSWTKKEKKSVRVHFPRHEVQCDSEPTTP